MENIQGMKPSARRGDCMVMGERSLEALRMTLKVRGRLSRNYNSIRTLRITQIPSHPNN